MAKIDEVRAALLATLVQKRATEQRLEALDKQADGLMNQLGILEQMETESTRPKDPPMMEQGGEHAIGNGQ